MLAREVLQKQIALLQLHVSEQSIQSYHFYSATGYKALKTLLDVEMDRAMQDVFTNDCLQAAIGTLESTKLPFYKFLFFFYCINILLKPNSNKPKLIQSNLYITATLRT